MKLTRKTQKLYRKKTHTLLFSKKDTLYYLRERLGVVSAGGWAFLAFFLSYPINKALEESHSIYFIFGQWLLIIQTYQGIVYNSRHTNIKSQESLPKSCVGTETIFLTQVDILLIRYIYLVFFNLFFKKKLQALPPVNACKNLVHSLSWALYLLPVCHSMLVLPVRQHTIPCSFRAKPETREGARVMTEAGRE